MHRTNLVRIIPGTTQSKPSNQFHTNQGKLIQKNNNTLNIEKNARVVSALENIPGHSKKPEHLIGVSVTVSRLCVN